MSLTALLQPNLFHVPQMDARDGPARSGPPRGQPHPPPAAAMALPAAQGGRLEEKAALLLLIPPSNTRLPSKRPLLSVYSLALLWGWAGRTEAETLRELP